MELSRFLTIITAVVLSCVCLVGPAVGCKPNFLPHEHREENPKAPWRSFNFTDVTISVEDECECGVRRSKLPRISGGQDAERNEFPWQAALVYRNTRIPFCGATLINNLFVLTAAHCLLNLPKLLMTPSGKVNERDLFVENDFQVLFNAHNLTPLNESSVIELYKRTFFKKWDLDPWDAELDYEEGTLRMNVAKKFYHPEFVTEYRKFGFDFDVGLIQLDRPIDFTSPTAPVPICLPSSSKFVSYEDALAVTVGWGRKNFKDMTSGSPVLQKLPMPVYSLDDCSETSGVPVSRRFICAGYHTKSKDIGKSDSGGPLLLDEDGKYTQIGIVSWGSGEKDGQVASAFTRVAAFLRWINYHILKYAHFEVVWCTRKSHHQHRTKATSLKEKRTRPPSLKSGLFQVVDLNANSLEVIEVEAVSAVAENELKDDTTIATTEQDITTTLEVDIVTESEDYFDVLTTTNGTEEFATATLNSSAEMGTTLADLMD